MKRRQSSCGLQFSNVKIGLANSARQASKFVHRDLSTNRADECPLVLSRAAIDDHGSSKISMMPTTRNCCVAGCMICEWQLSCLLKPVYRPHGTATALSACRENCQQLVCAVPLNKWLGFVRLQRRQPVPCSGCAAGCIHVSRRLPFCTAWLPPRLLLQLHARKLVAGVAAESTAICLHPLDPRPHLQLQGSRQHSAELNLKQICSAQLQLLICMHWRKLHDSEDKGEGKEQNAGGSVVGL